MLPELILREEKQDNYPLLALLGFLSAIIGYGVASIIFPSEAGLVTVFLAAIPLVFPLTTFFLEDERKGRPHLPEFFAYGSLFLGELLGFFLVALRDPAAFDLQISMFQMQLTGMGITGYAAMGTQFMGILANNLVVFAFILVVSALIGSAGAFILTWNASVFGVFAAILAKELPQGFTSFLSCSNATGSGEVASPMCYIPHATFEFSGFIVAGIAGSMMSAALYREHLDGKTWKNLIFMGLTGIGLIFIGAAIETGEMILSLVSIVITAVFAYQTAMTTQKLGGEE